MTDYATTSQEIEVREVAGARPPLYQLEVNGRTVGPPFDTEGAARNVSMWLRAALWGVVAAVDPEKAREALRPVREAPGGPGGGSA